MNKRIDLELIGKEFNGLTILEYSHVNRSSSFWKCQCICGEFCIVALHHLKSGDTKSCGCFKTYRYARGMSGLKKLYGRYKRNAKIKNRIFDLTIEDFKKVTSENCFYCGSKPHTESALSSVNEHVEFKDHMIYKYNGIDRIDSSKGYEKDNIVPCCQWCNIAKKDMSVEEFKEHIFKMHNYLNSDRALNEPALS
jgi:hypothetical protein